MAKTTQELLDLVSRMTLDEKIRCCALFEDRFGNLPRFGVAYRSCDNSSGGGADYFRMDRQEMEKETRENGKFWGTSFPQAAAQGAAWNPELSGRIGAAQGMECKNQQVDILLRPGVNMKRSPLCGRNFEYYSEDPWLTSELAAAFISGVQSQKVAANLKHFVCNSQEYERMTTNACVDERTFNELYLRVFQLILQKSDPWTLMSSYNRVNGKWVHQNKYIMEKLRGEFGYKGLVMSDAFAVHYEEDKIEGHLCGLDVELADESSHVDILKNAVNEGILPEKVLDEIAFRVLECYYKIHDGYTVPEVDLPAHHALAREAAAEGTILLENDGILPLEPGKSDICIIGAFAKEPSYMGGGSGHMNGHTLDIPFDEISALSASVTFAPGYSVPVGFPPQDVCSPEFIREAEEKARDAKTVIVFAGLPYGTESEGYDRTDYSLPESQRLLLDAVTAANQNVILVVSTGAPVDLTPWNKKVRALIQTGYAGEGSGYALAQIIFGLAEPGGRLPESYPLRIEDTPSYLSFPRYPDVMPDVEYGEGVYIGYRWYDRRKLEVAYPFGYGLSYTEFAYSNLTVEHPAVSAGQTVNVSFKVRNIGSRPGSDVAQIYVHDVQSSVDRPVRELRGFRKVFLQPGQEEIVTISLDRRAFEFYSPALHKWVVEDGDYEIQLGRSSRNILLTEMVTVHSADRIRRFSPKLPVEHFVKAPGFLEVLREVDQARAAFFDGSNQILPLVLAIPFGQFTRMDMGAGRLSDEAVQIIVDRLNQAE